MDTDRPKKPGGRVISRPVEGVEVTVKEKEKGRRKYFRLLHKRRQNMFKIKFIMLSIMILALVSGCASSGSTFTRPDTAVEANRALVGAWDVTVSRPAGVGKNLLTFSSDGTFFRSGDTHPVLSGGHGAWKRAGTGEFEATYLAFRFDQSGKWIGSTKTRIRITPSPGANEFTGVARVSTRDLQDKE